MATNKNAIVRYQALDRCFRNPGRRYTIDELVESCNVALLDLDPASSGVKRRQIFDDIKFMRDSQGFDAPIEAYKDGKKSYYHYSDTSFSITNQPLNEAEANQLREALLTLSRFKGLPQFEWIDEISARLESSFKLKSQAKVIEFEENPYLYGQEYLGELYHAIVNQKVLTIHYKPFKSDHSCDYRVHPYYLKQYNNRWFLWGLNDRENRLINIALDRIIEIEGSTEKYIQNKEIDFEEFFEDIIGVSIPPSRETVKIDLKIDADLWPYIKTKPIHGSQRVMESNDKFTIIRLELIPNYELESIIFSHADRVEVLAPSDLRDQIMQRIKTLYEKYYGSA